MRLDDIIASLEHQLDEAFWLGDIAEQIRLATELEDAYEVRRRLVEWLSSDYSEDPEVEAIMDSTGKRWP